MFRIILFLCAAALVVAAAWFFAGIPGHVVASFGNLTLDTTPAVAVLVVVVAVVVILLIWRLLTAILGIPGSGLRWRRRHRLAVGDRAVTRLLIALAAGEKDVARKEARRARALIGDSPQTLLLAAEASRLAGREDEAEATFRALAEHKEARFLGLRGLLRQAVDRGDIAEAAALAKQAETAHPGTVWLRQQRAELALQTDNWAEALDLIGQDARRPVYAVAAANAASDPSRALAFAKQAWKQDPAFPPAAIAYATRLRTAGKEKRALACVSDSWKRTPHPDLAAFALAPQTDKLARVQASQRLISANPANPESRYLLARESFDAGLVGEARNQIEAALREGVIQRRFYLLLAEIEEHQRGDTEAGRAAQREALRRAANTDADPVWQCASCHTTQTAWLPKCPNCGNVATLRWVTAARTTTLPVIAA